MAKKKQQLKVTQAEILTRAISSVEVEIGVWRKRYEDIPNSEELFDAATETLREKLDILKQLYLIETGVNF